MVRRPVRALAGLLPLVAACSGAPHPGTAMASQPAALTAASVGLPEQPEPEPAPAAPPARAPESAPEPAPSIFYHHHVCPPDSRGCVVTVTVTDEKATHRMMCPSGTGFGSERRLRRLALADVHGGHAGLARARLRRVLSEHVRALEPCFRGVTASTQLELDVEIDATGKVLAVDAGTIALADATLEAAARCAIARLRGRSSPRTGVATTVRIQLDYTVEDPRAYADVRCP